MTAAATGLDATLVLDAGKRITDALRPRHDPATVGWHHVILAEEVGRDLGRDVLEDLVAAVESLPRPTP